jgi:UDP-3-O-[3-hydroxymyristoyl] glucosamine N-acyltransferase
VNKIHPSSIIQNTNFGDNVFVSPLCSIGAAAFVSEGEWVMQRDGQVFFGDLVFVGSNTSIERGISRDTIIGSRVKIGSQVHISHDVHIEDDVVIMDGCILGHHSMVLKGGKVQQGTIVPPKEIISGSA